MTSERFSFVDVATEDWPAAAWVAQVPASIRDRDELFDVLTRELRLPGYFGRNWDALDECLRDLSWIDQRDVILAHHGLPFGLGSHGLAVYLQMLWANTEPLPESVHRLIVAFPCSSREDVMNLLSRPMP
jgi:hypothetical protein